MAADVVEVLFVAYDRSIEFLRIVGFYNTIVL